MSNTKDPRQQAVTSALEVIQKQFGKGSIMRLGDVPQESLDVISTGVMPLDLALGVGGIPKGRIVEIYGPEASGKTTVCLSIIAEMQKSGGIAAFIDAEHALDPRWANTLGVKLEDLLHGVSALHFVETQ
jgi:recombination protein RecA